MGRINDDIFIMSHGPFSLENGKYSTHYAKAKFINDLSRFYKQVIVYADIIGDNHSDYELISQSQIESKSVTISPFWRVGAEKEERGKTLLKKYIYFVKMILSEKNKWNHLFLFQSFYSVIILMLLWGTRTHPKTILYIAGDLEESFSYREKSKNLIVKSLFSIAYFVFRKLAIKKADIILVHGQKLYDKFYQPGGKIEKIIPMRVGYTYSDDYSNLTQNKLIFVGRLIRSKGVDFLIKSVSKLQQRNISVQLNIIGSGPEEETLKSLTKKLNLENSVKFLGFIKNTDELKREYRDTQLLVLPSLTEGFPRVIYEAIENGVMILSSDAGGIKTFITNKKKGFILPVSELNRLDEYIENALSLPLRAKQRIVAAAAASLKNQQEEYNNQDTAQQVASLFSDRKNKYDFR